MPGDHQSNAKPACARKGELVAAAVVWLLLGALVNVAVAWALSLLIDPFSIGAANSPPGSVQAWNRLGARRSEDGVYWWAAAATGGAGALRLNAATREAGEFDDDYGDDPRDVVPRWWRPEGWGPNAAEPMQAAAEARGWPLLSMWHGVRYRDHVGGRGRMQSLGGFEVSLLPVWRDPTPFSNYDQPRTLPLRVIPSGFALSAAFYALLLWLIVTAPRAWRRRRRAKRGLCPHCAYPVGPSPVCTECGSPVQPRAIFA